MSDSENMVSDSDLFVQDALHISDKWTLRRQSIRMLRAGGNPLSEKYHGIRTCHTFWHFCISYNNELHLELDDGQVHEVRDTDVTVIPPWLPVRHHIAHGDAWHAYVQCGLIHVPGELSRHLFRQPVRLYDAILQQRFMDFAHDIKLNGYQPSVIRSLLGQEIASKAFLLLIEQMDEKQRSLFLDPSQAWIRLQPVINYIQEHLHKAMSVDELADILSVGSDHFTRVFKQTIGQTPVQFIINQRVTRAAELLFTTELKLDDIALRCGFPNRRYLSRRFVKELGMTPNQVRHRI